MTKIACIPPIVHDNKFVIDLVKKPIPLILFLSKQCSIIENNCVLPSSTKPITDQYLANIEFTKDDIKESSVNLILLKPLFMT